LALESVAKGALGRVAPVTERERERPRLKLGPAIRDGSPAGSGWLGGEETEDLMERQATFEEELVLPLADDGADTVVLCTEPRDPSPN
jgi:hypothetical protein